MPFKIEFDLEQFEYLMEKGVHDSFVDFQQRFPDKIPVYVAIQTTGYGAYNLLVIVTLNQALSIASDENQPIRDILNHQGIADIPHYSYVPYAPYLDLNNFVAPSIDEANKMLNNLQVQMDVAYKKYPRDNKISASLFQNEVMDTFMEYWAETTNIYSRVIQQIHDLMTDQSQTIFTGVCWSESEIYI